LDTDKIDRLPVSNVNREFIDHAQTGSRPLTPTSWSRSYSGVSPEMVGFLRSRVISPTKTTHTSHGVSPDSSQELKKDGYDPFELG